jgi:ATP-dependent Clp protease adapter protein ClpS
MATRVGLTRIRFATTVAYQVTPFHVAVKPKVKLPNLSTDVPPHYKIILHKDIDFNHKHVSRVLTSVIVDMRLPEANDKATEAFIKGRSLLRVCPEDIATNYCNDIKKQNVSTTIEPVDFF